MFRYAVTIKKAEPLALLFVFMVPITDLCRGLTRLNWRQVVNCCGLYLI